MKAGPWASMLAPLVLMTGCGGNGPASAPRAAGTEFEQLHGADVERAAGLYRAGRREEGAAILRTLGTSGDWSVRSRAVRAIGEVRDRSLLPVVHAALKDARLEVRESAGRVLATLGDASSREPLLAALRDEAGVVRTHAAAALVRAVGLSELPAVAAVVERDADPEVRALTVLALAEVRDPAVAEVLIGALDDVSPMVRGEAADAVGASDSPAARAALEKIAASDSDATVRARATAALQRLAAPVERGGGR